MSVRNLALLALGFALIACNRMDRLTGGKGGAANQSQVSAQPPAPSPDDEDPSHRSITGAIDLTLNPVRGFSAPKELTISAVSGANSYRDEAVAYVDAQGKYPFSLRIVKGNGKEDQPVEFVVDAFNYSETRTISPSQTALTTPIDPFDGNF